MIKGPIEDISTFSNFNEIHTLALDICFQLTAQSYSLEFSLYLSNWTWSKSSHSSITTTSGIRIKLSHPLSIKISTLIHFINQDIIPNWRHHHFIVQLLYDRLKSYLQATSASSASTKSHMLDDFGPV